MKQVEVNRRTATPREVMQEETGGSEQKNRSAEGGDEDETEGGESEDYMSEQRKDAPGPAMISCIPLATDTITLHSDPSACLPVPSHFSDPETKQTWTYPLKEFPAWCASG